ERGDISTGKNIFARKRVGRPRPTHTSDGMEQHHSVIFHQIRGTSEKCFEIRGADMFKHADRNDPVKLPRVALCKIAIVDKLKTDLIRDAFFAGPLLCNFKLFLTQRNAKYLNSKFMVQVERHPAPAATDIKHALTR